VLNVGCMFINCEECNSELIGWELPAECWDEEKAVFEGCKKFTSSLCTVDGTDFY
jgi:hypothetical protein